jgi:hypothetical protein
MDKFLVLYNSPTPAAEMMASLTPEQAEAGMAEWNAWADSNRDAIVDLGVPLGTGRHLEGGSSSAGSSQATGYSIIQAENVDAAAKMLEDHPHFRTPGGATIDVLEFLQMPGM